MRKQQSTNNSWAPVGSGVLDSDMWSQEIDQMKTQTCLIAKHMNIKYLNSELGYLPINNHVCQELS